MVIGRLFDGMGSSKGTVSSDRADLSVINRCGPIWLPNFETACHGLHGDIAEAEQNILIAVPYCCLG